MVPIASLQIPFIRDAMFLPVSKSNTTTITNSTCHQCLCMFPSSSYLMLNCLPNNTCQFFSYFPRTYKIQAMTSATLYFVQGIFPNASQCCMPNLTYVLDKLKNTVPTYTSVPGPRCLTIDNYGYLVTVSLTGSSIVRLNAIDMTLISQAYSLVTSPMTLKYYSGNYYIGLSNRIVVVDSNTLTIRNNITSASLSGTRDMMFINNGDILVVASTNNKYFLFFNRTNNASTNYTLAYSKLVNYTNPHGLLFINDTYFYATSWGYNTVYSYSAVQDSTWKESLLFDPRSIAPTSDGNHITLDECGRIWYSLGNYGLRIFDGQGGLLGNFTLTNTSVFDTIITDNYVIYLSDTQSNRLIRIDPGISC